MMKVYVSLGCDGVSLTDALEGDTEAELERQLIERLRKWWRRYDAVRAVEREEVPSV
jgi:hypothetical protein